MVASFSEVMADAGDAQQRNHKENPGDEDDPPRVEEERPVGQCQHVPRQAYSSQHGLSCIGLTLYSEKRIYVPTASSTIHEFGHFLDWALGFPSEHEALYREEAQSARTVLREYATTNSHEYFADCFAFWIRNSDDDGQMERLNTAAPKTYAYFSELEAHDWSAE